VEHQIDELVTSQHKNEKRLSWFESGKSLKYIIESLQKSKQKIRIATGFFTIKGWNLIRRYTKGKQTYL
jgi:hypothetical protein